MGKNKGGRPSKYPRIDLAKVEYYGSLGLIDEEIALLLEISEKTLNNYKKKIEFLQSIKKGKAQADSKVVDALYKRAVGFEYEEVRSEYEIKSTIEGEKAYPSKIIKTKKMIPSDPASAIIWLKNRQPDRWKDKRDVGISAEVKLIVSNDFLPQKEK